MNTATGDKNKKIGDSIKLPIFLFVFIPSRNF